MLDHSITLYAFILAVGAIQAIFLVSILVIAVHSRKANIFLALFIACFAYDLVYQLLTELNLIQYIPQLVLFESSTDLLFGPLLYLYVNLITGRQSGINKSNIKHFLPVVILVLTNIVLLANYSKSDIQEFITLDSLDYFPGLGIVSILATLAGISSIVTYIIFTFSAINKHQHRVDDNYSYHDKLDLQWIKNILLLVTLLFVILLFWLVSSIYMLQDNVLAEKVIFITLTVIIFYLGFKGISQPQVFSIHTKQNNNTTPTVDDSPEIDLLETASYANSSLGIDESKLIIEELKSMIETDQCFLNPKLTLKDLADLSGFKMHYISQAINQNENNNFFGFINQYRIEYAKKLLTASIATTPNILTIAMDSGFNSKSSFYTTFKKMTQMTPLQFRQRG